MARASNIYIVHPTGDQNTILAAFTVKYESQLWAERIHGLDDVQRYRLRDAGEWGWCKDGNVERKIPSPWETKT